MIFDVFPFVYRSTVFFVFVSFIIHLHIISQGFVPNGISAIIEFIFVVRIEFLCISRKHNGVYFCYKGYLFVYIKEIATYVVYI